MNKTSIEWTDFTANPIKFRDASGKVVWGCVHASLGCVNCYAETLAHRYGKGGPFNVQTMAGLAPFLDDKELHKMRTYKPAAGKRCFVGDMTDILGPWVPDDLLLRLFDVFRERQDVTWQVLTKRADRMRAFASSLQWDGSANGGSGRLWLEDKGLNRQGSPISFMHVLRNVWLGVSCEDQQRADERIPHLLQTPSAVRFISAEPLIGPVNLSAFITGPSDHAEGYSRSFDWVIVGGESGSGSRPCEDEWVRSLVSECSRSGVACFVKQLGSYRGGLQSWKGNDMSEWPEDLRVREFPRGSGGGARD